MTAAEGRKFGLTVGGAFIVIGLLMLWRHHATRATVTLGLGAAFALAGLAIPTQLGPVERAWMKLAHLISRVTTPIFMGVVYYVVMTPLGWMRRAAGSPLWPKGRAESRWEKHTDDANIVARMERQF